jgi:tetratricopeptide (TPR) repeat protein
MQGSARPRLRTALCALAVALLAHTACAGARPLAYTPDLLRETAARKGRIEPAEVPVPFAVDVSTVEVVRRLVPRAGSAEARARALADALVSPSRMGLQHRTGQTGTGAEVLASGGGNCFALSSLFIGLARELGLDAYYVDASDQVQDLTESAGFVVSSGHVSAVVRTGSGTSVVDFDGEVKSYRTLRILDDVQALAHFFNNRGYELLVEAVRAGADPPWADARARFELASRLHPGLARAWNNLGIADARLGRFREAERSYRMAIEQDPRLSEPHSNLGVLDLESGRTQSALRAFERAIDLAPRNPYHHYHRALALAASGSVERAIESLERALALDPGHAESREKLVALRSDQR